MRKNTDVSSKKELSARDFVEAADTKRIFIYRKDGYVLCFLRIYPYNINLKSEEEKRAETEALAATFKKDRKDFVYFTLPREIDLDKYKELLKEKYAQETHIGKRHILAAMMEQCSILVTNGENYEHQHFIKIWKKGNNKATVEEELRERITEFQIRYKNAGIECEILKEQEIVKLCNLYGNSLLAVFESNDSAMYTPISQF